MASNRILHDNEYEVKQTQRLNKMANAGNILELRIALTVDNFDQVVDFYQKGMGLTVFKSWDEPTGRGVILNAGRATLEVIDRHQAEHIDEVEAGARVSGPVRIAMEFPDITSAINAAQTAGGRLIGGPIIAPWNTHVARFEVPGEMQLTVFQEPED